MNLKTECRKETVKTAVMAALIFGFVTHLFGLVNILHNNDDIWQQPMGYGAGITSGRWLLTILGDSMMRWGLGYNLSVVNGVVFLVMIAVSAGGVISVFRIRSKVSAALIGMIFATFPSVTSVLFFKYTTIHYGLAILLSVMAAWVLQGGIWGIVLSGLCTALSMGIYQAYVPITITILVLLLIQQALEGESDVRQIVRRGLYFCAALIAGVVLYFIFLKISLAVYGEALSDYQGVDNMGKISLGALPGLVLRAIKDFCKLPLYDYCGLAGIPLLKLLYVVLAGFTALLVGYILLVKVKKISLILITAMLCAVLPIAINFVVIMCPDTVLYTLMVYSFVLLPCMPLIFFECLPPMEKLPKGKSILGKAIAVAVSLMIFCYAYYDNVNYTAMYYSNRQVENYWSTIVSQVRMTEGFDAEKEWAVIGNIDDPLLYGAWEDGVTYGGNRFTEDLLNQYSRLAWVSNYLGIKVPAAGEERIAELSAMPEVQEMPCWPTQGSIKVVDDTVVIKFQNME